MFFVVGEGKAYVQYRFSRPNTGVVDENSCVTVAAPNLLANVLDSIEVGNVAAVECYI
jgi:hypothetical protein